MTHALPSGAHGKSNHLRLGKPASKAPLPAQDSSFEEFTSHQLSLSRLMKSMHKKQSFYTPICTRTSPGILTCRDAPFPARRTTREHQIAGVSHCRSGDDTTLTTIGHWQRRNLRTSCRRPELGMPCAQMELFATLAVLLRSWLVLQTL